MKKHLLLPNKPVQLGGIKNSFYSAATKVEIHANPKGLSPDSIVKYSFKVKYLEASGVESNFYLSICAPTFFDAGRPENNGGPFTMVIVESLSDTPIEASISFTDKLI